MLLIDNVGNYLYWIMRASTLRLILISSTWDCITFHSFNVKVEKKNQKLADLWLVGEMVNRIGIYGSKVAEGLSAFQRRSCLNLLVRRLPFHNLPSCLYIRNIVPVLQHEYYIWVFHHLIIITKIILCSSKKSYRQAKWQHKMKMGTVSSF